MGKITGFMELAAHPGGVRCRSPSACKHYREFVARADRRRSGEAGRALHGLRHSVLPDAAARSTTSFRTGTTSSTGSTGARRSTCCTRPTTSPSSPAASARRRARRRARSTSTTTRSASSRSSTPSSTRAGTKAGSRRSRRSARPASRSPWSARARRAWPARSSSRAPGTTSSLFEKNDRIGGLLRYGIPDFKMEKHLIDRRMEQMRGRRRRVPPRRRTSATTCRRRELLAEFDAVVLTGGAEQPRDLPVPGRELDGVHFAMEFLPQQNKVVAGDDGAGPDLGRRASTWSSSAAATPAPTASARRTGTARRRSRSSSCCRSRPSTRTSRSSGRTGRSSCARRRRTRKAASATGRSRPSASRAANGKVEKLDRRARRMAEGRRRPDEDGRSPGHRIRDQGRPRAARDGLPRPGADGLLEQLGVERDARGNVKADTDGLPDVGAKVFAAGDMRRGQSLVVWAIREGRQCARAVDEFLMGASELPR